MQLPSSSERPHKLRHFSDLHYNDLRGPVGQYGHRWCGDLDYSLLPRVLSVLGQHMGSGQHQHLSAANEHHVLPEQWDLPKWLDLDLQDESTQRGRLGPLFGYYIRYG